MFLWVYVCMFVYLFVCLSVCVLVCFVLCVVSLLRILVAANASFVEWQLLILRTTGTEKIPEPVWGSCRCEHYLWDYNNVITLQSYRHTSLLVPGIRCLKGEHTAATTVLVSYFLSVFSSLTSRLMSLRVSLCFCCSFFRIYFLIQHNFTKIGRAKMQ